MRTDHAITPVITVHAITVFTLTQVTWSNWMKLSAAGDELIEFSASSLRVEEQIKMNFRMFAN